MLNPALKGLRPAVGMTSHVGLGKEEITDQTHDGDQGKDSVGL